MIFLNIKFIKFHGIAWNSIELQFWGKIKSSMEIHGIPWNSGVWKKFHGIPWNFGSGQNSMEFHGTYCLLFNGTIGIINTLSFKMGYNIMEFEFPNFDENYIQLCRMNQFP